MFFKGIMLGLSIAAPVGPIGILCINRSLQNGFSSGFATGCGAATADGVYGCIVAFGLMSISTMILQYQDIIKIFGAVFLGYLGLKSMMIKDSPRSATVQVNNVISNYHSAFFLTITNPMTILFFIAAILGFHDGTVLSLLDSFRLILGVVLGSMLWWLFLCGVVHKLQSHMKLSEKIYKIINFCSGAALIIFGVSILFSTSVMGFVD